MIQFTSGLLEFRCGSTCTIDTERSGRPSQITTEEMVNRIHDIMLEDCRMKGHEIAKKVNVSTKCVFNKLYEFLGIKK